MATLAPENDEARAARALRDKEYEEVLDRGLAHYTPSLPVDASEDDILAAAVRIIAIAGERRRVDD
jgi:hypothetical protein